jgi:dTDP-4-dehydrorhamnose 3,5-epimerase
VTVLETSLPGVLILEPRVFKDDRGVFAETWQAERYADAGLEAEFVQDNISLSVAGVLRGLHFQHPTGQGKLITAISGSIYDVAVDVRRESPTFGQWVGVELSGDTLHQLYVPVGFAHGFQALTDACVSYKCTRPYNPAHERSIRWDDEDLGIRWPGNAPLLSNKDRAAPRLGEIPAEMLPRMGSRGS